MSISKRHGHGPGDRRARRGGRVDSSPWPRPTTRRPHRPPAPSPCRPPTPRRLPSPSWTGRRALPTLTTTWSLQLADAAQRGFAPATPASSARPRAGPIWLVPANGALCLALEDTSDGSLGASCEPSEAVVTRGVTVGDGSTVYGLAPDGVDFRRRHRRRQHDDDGRPRSRRRRLSAQHWRRDGHCRRPQRHDVLRRRRRLTDLAGGARGASSRRATDRSHCSKDNGATGQRHRRRAAEARPRTMPRRSPSSTSAGKGRSSPSSCAGRATPRSPWTSAARSSPPRWAPLTVSSATGSGSAGAWIFTIARNTLLTSIRRGQVEEQARRRLAYWEPVILGDVDLDAIVALAVRRPGADGRAGATARPPARAIRARILEERSYDEIADQLQCSELVVRKTVSRGLQGPAQHRGAAAMTYVPQQKANLVIAAAATPQPPPTRLATSRRARRHRWAPRWRRMRRRTLVLALARRHAVPVTVTRGRRAARPTARRRARHRCRRSAPGASGRVIPRAALPLVAALPRRRLHAPGQAGDRRRTATTRWSARSAANARQFGLSARHGPRDGPRRRPARLAGAGQRLRLHRRPGVGNDLMDLGCETQAVALQVRPQRLQHREHLRPAARRHPQRSR